MNRTSTLFHCGCTDPGFIQTQRALKFSKLDSASVQPKERRVGQKPFCWLLWRRSASMSQFTGPGFQIYFLALPFLMPGNDFGSPPRSTTQDNFRANTFHPDWILYVCQYHATTWSFLHWSLAWRLCCNLALLLPAYLTPRRCSRFGFAVSERFSVYSRLVLPSNQVKGRLISVK